MKLKWFLHRHKEWLFIQVVMCLCGCGVTSALIFVSVVFLATYLGGWYGTDFIPLEGLIWAAFLSATFIHALYAVMGKLLWREKKVGEGFFAAALGGASPGIVAALALAGWPISMRFLVAAISLSCSFGPFLGWKLLAKKRSHERFSDL